MRAGETTRKDAGQVRGGGRKRRAAIQIRSLTLVPPSRAVQSRISLGHGVKRVSRPHLRGLTRKRGVNSTINSARVRNQCSTGGGGGGEEAGGASDIERSLALRIFLRRGLSFIALPSLTRPRKHFQQTFAAKGLVGLRRPLASPLPSLLPRVG